MSSKIPWTDVTWNPTRGCTKISPGCKHCYAATRAVRLARLGAGDYPTSGFQTRTNPSHLMDPLKKTTSKMIFVDSMSDLFHEDFPFAYIDKVFAVIEAAHWHVFQILTKRSYRMQQYMTDRLSAGLTIPENAILGVSVEDRQFGIPRIRDLKATPAAARMLSIEPLLEPLNLMPDDLTDMDWVIVGGESGEGSRHMDPGWAEEIRVQCLDARVPFFFKQVSAFRPDTPLDEVQRLHYPGLMTREWPSIRASTPPSGPDRRAILARVQSEISGNPAPGNTQLSMLGEVENAP